MSNQDILQQLISFRGLKDGFQATPLRHFRGKLDSFVPELVTRFTPPRTYVAFKFSDIGQNDVLETTEPYTLPIAQITLPHSEQKKSQWGVFAMSTLKFLGDGEDIPNLIGKRIELKLTGGHMMWDRDKGMETPRECWEVLAVSGGVITPQATGITAQEQALKLLDGKTIQEWNQTVFQDKIVQTDDNLITSIVNRTFLPPLEMNGTVAKDENGVYHISVSPK